MSPTLSFSILWGRWKDLSLCSVFKINTRPRGEERRGEETRGDETRRDETRGEERRGEERRGEERRGEERRGEERSGGVEWSGVEESGVEWSGVEWSGSTCKIAHFFQTYKKSNHSIVEPSVPKQSPQTDV